MDFPGKNLPLPHRPFPFDFPASALPTEVPDCHLVRTAIPRLPSYDSLGVFHDRVCHSLSLFCKHGFQKRFQRLFRPATFCCMILFSLMLTQGRLHYTQHTTLRTALQVPILVRMRAGLKLEELSVVTQHQVSTETGSYVPCHWDAPWILNPQHPPKTGRNKQTPGTSSMCPSKDF